MNGLALPGGDLVSPLVAVEPQHRQRPVDQAGMSQAGGVSGT